MVVVDIGLTIKAHGKKYCSPARPTLCSQNGYKESRGLGLMAGYLGGGAESLFFFFFVHK
jgi:hypothetical protein